MKRALDSLAGVHKIMPKTSDNSTSTGSHMKRIKRNASRPKQLRRGASHASSAQEFMKSEWTCDELNLNKQMPSLSELAQDKFKLVEELFSIFSILELKEFTPDILKEYSVNQLKELCLEELNSISTAKLKFMTDGNDPQDFVEPESSLDDKAIGDTSDGIQLSVDDNEYSDFLGAESLEPRKSKKVMKDAEVQANWSSLESSSSDDTDSDHKDGEGWMNLWKLEQMEILELEMRARAIRMLLKQEEVDDSAQSSSQENQTIESKQDSEENKVSNTSDSKVENQIEKQFVENQKQINSNSKLESTEILDTQLNQKDEQNQEIQNKNKSKDSDEDNEDKAVDNTDQRQDSVEVEVNENTLKVQSNEDKESVLNEDNNQELDVDKSETTEEVVQTNENIESEEENKHQKKEISVNKVSEQSFSPKEEIILVNEEFDEELEEEDESDHNCDKQLLV